MQNRAAAIPMAISRQQPCWLPPGGSCVAAAVVPATTFRSQHQSDSVWQPSAGKCIINFHINFKSCLAQQQNPQSRQAKLKGEKCAACGTQVPDTCSCCRDKAAATATTQRALVVNFSQLTATFVQYAAFGGSRRMSAARGPRQLTCRQVQDKIKLGNSQVFEKNFGFFLQFLFGNLFYLLQPCCCWTFRRPLKRVGRDDY